MTGREIADNYLSSPLCTVWIVGPVLLRLIAIILGGR